MIASVLSFFLIYVSQNDPNLEQFFPYFRLGNKYYSYYSNFGADEMKKLMEVNKLDYEFKNTNSRFCSNIEKPAKNMMETLNLKQDSTNTDYEFLNDYFADNQGILDDEKSLFKNKQPNLDVIMLIISQAGNFKHRLATRQTWGKYLAKLNTKLVFMIGNPFYRRAKVEQTTDSHITTNFNSQDQIKLNQEIKDYNDLVQINMEDNDNYTSTKTLVSIRWALTYCTTAKYLFILSDSAILNVERFEKILKNDILTQKSINSTSIAGLCDLEDLKFASALKSFYTDLYNKHLVKQESNQDTKNTASKNTTLNTKLAKEESPRSIAFSNTYKGQYCSNLGWLIDINAARRLWQTSLRSRFIMRISPAYLNGYLAYKSNLNHVNLFKYHDSVPQKTNCLKVFSAEPNYLLCAENFTISSRYTNYIATWNQASAQSQFVLAKL
jgi:hypothetical protein